MSFTRCLHRTPARVLKMLPDTERLHAEQVKSPRQGPGGLSGSPGAPQGPSENHCPSSILYCLPCTSRELVIPIESWKPDFREIRDFPTRPAASAPPKGVDAHQHDSQEHRPRNHTYRTRPRRQRGGGAHGPQGRAGRRRTRAPGKDLQRGSTAAEAKWNQTPATESMRQ